jgi:leader peptidase (prepilin peptidase)/N-methyltransferase
MWRVPDPVWLPLLLSPGAKVLAFVWGALWGSFTNVVIHRVPRGLSVVRPRSRCGGCGAEVRAIDNIPIISWLLLGGRCRACRAPFSARYLVVEILAGCLSFALWIQKVQVPALRGEEPRLLAYAAAFVLCLALLAITYIDLDFWIVPDVIVLPLAILGLAVAAAAPKTFAVGWIEAVAASAAGFLLFAGIRWYYLRFRGIEGLGLGDAKLLAMVGAFLGVQGLAWTVAAGAVQGLLVSVPLLLTGRQVANSDLQAVHGDDPTLGQEDPAAGVGGRRVPFGPFLALAGLEFVLLEAPIRAGFAWLLGVPT